MRTIYRIADRQLGLLTRADLRRVLTDRQIEHLICAGLILRVHRGVYRLPGSSVTVEQRALAACLAVGSHAVASHATAARLWGLVDRALAVEVTVPNAHRSELPNIVVHRTLHLARDEVTRIGPVPVTRVERTIADLPRDLREAALDEALRRRLTTPAKLARYPRLRALADDRTQGVPESELERRAIAVLKRHRLPAPKRQHKVGRYRIDLAYPDHRVAIELEGRAPHYGRERWQRDHDRRNTLELAGWHVLTFTWWNITKEPRGFAERLRTALRARSPSRRDR